MCGALQPPCLAGSAHAHTLAQADTAGVCAVLRSCRAVLLLLLLLLLQRSLRVRQLACTPSWACAPSVRRSWQQCWSPYTTWR
jgi:hypothetical protein